MNDTFYFILKDNLNPLLISFAEGLEELGYEFGANKNACKREDGSYLFNSMNIEALPKCWIICESINIIEHLIYDLKKNGYRILLINDSDFIKRSQSTYLNEALYPDAIFFTNFDIEIKKSLKNFNHIFPISYYLNKKQIETFKVPKERNNLIVFPHQKFSTTIQLINDFYVMNIGSHENWKFKEYDEIINDLDLNTEQNDDISKLLDGLDNNDNDNNNELEYVIDENKVKVMSQGKIIDTTSGYFISQSDRVLSPQSVLTGEALLVGAVPVFSSLNSISTEVKWKHGMNCWMINFGELLDANKSNNQMEKLLKFTEKVNPYKLREFALKNLSPNNCASYILSCLKTINN